MGLCFPAGKLARLVSSREARRDRLSLYRDGDGLVRLKIKFVQSRETDG